MYFKLYRDKADEWRWNLHAANHLKVANSGEGYNNKQDAVAAIDLVKGTDTGTPVREE